MCVVSNVMDQWWPKHPMPERDPYRLPDIQPAPKMPNEIPWPVIQKDPELAQRMLEVLQRLEAIDKRLGLLEQCSVEAKDKKRIKARLRRIAKKGKKAKRS